MKSTTVSVIMPAYNAGAYIGEAIQSILCQTFSNIEFIIVDDTSTDQTANVIHQFNDRRICYHRNERNVGVAATLNKAISMSHGDYLARMDADDVADVDRIRKQVMFLEQHPQVGVCGTGVYLYDGKRDYATKRFSPSTVQIAVDLLFGSALAHPSVMMRHDLFSEHMQYETMFLGCEDYRLWTRLIMNTGICNLDEPLLHYRKHQNQITAKPCEQRVELLRMIRSDYCTALGRRLSESEQALLEKIGNGNRNLSEKEKAQLYELFLDLIPALSSHFGKRQQIKELFSQVFFSVHETRIADYRRLSTCRTIAHRIISR